MKLKILLFFVLTSICSVTHCFRSPIYHLNSQRCSRTQALFRSRAPVVSKPPVEILTPIASIQKASNPIMKVLYAINELFSSFTQYGIEEGIFYYALASVLPLSLLGLFVTFGSWMDKKETAKEQDRFAKEKEREARYKENMYFDAVQDILEELKKKDLKTSKAAILMEELSDLDPDGKIRQFVQHGGARPSIQSATQASKATSNGSSNESKQIPPVDKEIDETLESIRKLLQEDLESSKIDQLLKYLRNNLKAVPSAAEKMNVIKKIKDKAQNKSYWLDYGKRVLS